MTPAPGDAAYLLTRTAYLMRQLADAATNHTGAAYWFSDKSERGRCSVISEHVGHYVVDHAWEPVAQHVARWDPDTAAAAAGLLEHAARCIRHDGRIGDHSHALVLARAFMRSYGEPTP